MVRIRKFGAGFVLAAVAFLAGCNGDGNGVLRYPSEGDFVVTIGPTAEGSLFTDKRTADAYQTVTIWIKPGKVPVVTRDDKEGTQLLTNGGISPDPSLKSKLGIEVGQIYTFVMPESDVTITIPGEIPEDPDVFIKNITMQSVPLYTADEPDIFINDGAPGPSIRNVSVVTQNSNGKIKIKIDRGAQKVISYQIGNNGDKIDLEDAADFEIDSPPLDGSLSLKVFASDGATERVYPYMIYNYDPPPNNDALLYSLTISDVTFNFNSTQFNYDLTSSPVDNSVNQVTVTAVTNHTAAAITLNGAPSASGTGVQFNLAKTGLTPDKANVVTLTVTPETGAADAKTYTIKIYRKLSANADLASLVVSGATVSPAFSANTTAYSNSTAKVSYSTALAALKASPANANATMALQVGEDQAFPMFMGIDYDVALLNYGNDVNTAKVIVSAEDGVTTKTYTVTLHRNAPAVVSENAKLTGISVKTVSGADVALSPAFAASTYLYSNPVKLAASDDQVVVSATAASGCTITVNSASVNIDGTGGKTVDLLNSGNNANTIALLVTSADGGEQTYFVKLYRERSSDASLKALSVTNPSIIFTFSPDQLVYDLNGDTQKIESSINTAMITATAARVTSKIKTNYTTVISGVGSLVPLTGTINAPDEIAVDVTAEDGTEKHYKVRIYRKLSSDARLADLSVTGGGLSLSGFTLLSASSTENPAYNLNTNNTPVPFSVNAIAVRPVVNHSGASIKIGIVTVTSGLNYNWNFTGNGGSVVKMSLAIVVTAQDGVT
ncbi:MAG: cadherin-like beta sandwich domain-containing protein, partial [Spirochaetaceae bacterium]|nr:cadherin-like beta sandwich domain-containing protein [Spirochaetaceae bacterium]